MSIMHFASVIPLGPEVSFSISGVLSSGPGARSVSVTFDRNGEFREFSADSGTFTKDWIQPKGATVGDAYEIRYTKNSGDDPTSGTLNVWLPLMSSQGIGYSSSSARLLGNFTAEVRRATDGKVLDSDAFPMEAWGGLPP